MLWRVWRWWHECSSGSKASYTMSSIGWMCIALTDTGYFTALLPEIQSLYNARRVERSQWQGYCNDLLQLGWKGKASDFLYWDRKKVESVQKESCEGLRNFLPYQAASLDNGENIFEWITLFNQRIGSSKRKVLLPVDNYSAHDRVKKLPQLEKFEI